MADTVKVNDGTGSAILTDEVTTVDGAGVSARHAQQVKVGHGADGTYTSVAAASPLEVRLYAAGGVAISDDGSGRVQVKAVSDQLPSSLGVGGTLNADLPNVTAAAPLEVRLYDVGGTPVSTDSNRLQVKAVTDQLPSALVGGALSVLTQDMNSSVGLWNGLGPDGPRTTTFSSANQSNLYGHGLAVHLRVATVPGGDTIKVRVNTRAHFGGGFITWESAPISTAIDRVFFLYPGADTTYMPAGLQVGEVVSVPLAKTFNVSIIHSGSGSFTYDLSYSLVQ